MKGFGGISKGGRVDVHLLHGARASGSSWWTSASPPACGSCSPTRTWARRSRGHPRAGRAYLVLSVAHLQGYAARRGGQGVGGRAARDQRGRAGRGRPRPLGDRLDVSGCSRPTSPAHGASGPVVRVLRARVCGVALVLVVVIALARPATWSSTRPTSSSSAKMLGAFMLVDLCAVFFGCTTTIVVASLLAIVGIFLQARCAARGRSDPEHRLRRPHDAVHR